MYFVAHRKTFTNLFYCVDVLDFFIHVIAEIKIKFIMQLKIII